LVSRLTFDQIHAVLQLLYVRWLQEFLPSSWKKMVTGNKKDLPPWSQLRTVVTVLVREGFELTEVVDPTIGTVTNPELWGDFFATLGDGDEVTRQTANRTVVSLAQHGS
jgi:hypothetical protein